MIGSAGAYPTLPGVAGPTKPDDAAVVSPNWASVSSRKSQLLSDYAKIFGG